MRTAQQKTARQTIKNFKYWIQKTSKKLDFCYLTVGLLNYEKMKGKFKASKDTAEKLNVFIAFVLIKKEVEQSVPVCELTFSGP